MIAFTANELVVQNDNLFGRDSLDFGEKLPNFRKIYSKNTEIQRKFGHLSSKMQRLSLKKNNIFHFT